MLNVDLLDQRYAHLDLFVSKTSWRRLQDMSLSHVFKTSSKRLQRNNFLSSKTSWRHLEDVFKTFSRRLEHVFARRLEDVLEDKKLLRWRRVQDLFKKCLEDVFKTSWRPTYVCWVNYSMLLIFIIRCNFRIK